mgnify:FL=1
MYRVERLASSETAQPGYEFTNDWFEYQRYTIEAIKPMGDLDRKRSILEIGAHEGRSTVYYIDHCLEHPESTITTIDPFDVQDPTSPLTGHTYRRFLSNVSKSRYPFKSELLKGYSCQKLAELITQGKSYDYIAIDGSHLMADVLLDACLSYRLLKVGGVLFFDDYNMHAETREVRQAVNAFLGCHSGVEVVHKSYHLVARKTG